MKKNDKLIVLLGVIILVVASIGVYYWAPEGTKIGAAEMEDFFSISSSYSREADAIVACDSNPFYALIATPLAVHYNSDLEQHVKPLYVKDFTETSDAILRAEKEIGITPTLTILSHKSAKVHSLEIADYHWESSEAVLLLEDSEIGYNLGIVATPLASYLGIPVIVTDEIDDDVREVLNDLGVTKSIVCGDLDGYGQKILKFDNVDEIVNASIELVEEKFGDVKYITLANPLDVIDAKVIESTSYSFDGTLSSGAFMPSQIVQMAVGTITKKAPVLAFHEFNVEKDYKYARLKFDIKNLVEEDVEETGSILQPILYDPEGNSIAYMFTSGGIPVRDAEGGIIEDRVGWETIVYDQSGTYTIQVSGQFLTSKKADYDIDVTVEKLESSLVPSMKGLSSVAPYLTAYRKGIVFAKPEFAFVADEQIVEDLSSYESGIVYPASNPKLIDLSNEHTFKIHESLNKLLAKLQGYELEGDHDRETLKTLKDIYYDAPVYIAIVGGAEMIPQYYYYDTPDANTIKYGWDVASDFIYGNIDPIPRNDKLQNNHPADRFISEDYDEYYPYQENIVGRITGWDVQDASALIARTIFYNDILENMDNEEWKNTALVQTGSGTDFQRIPFVDAFRKLLLGVHEDELGIKWPTGSTHFENLHLKEVMKKGFYDVRSTENAKSSRKGLSQQTLKEINQLGLLNRLLFPKLHVQFVAGEASIKPPTGGRDQMESNFIFSFGHGQPMGYGHADVQLDSLGFRPIIIDNMLNRFFFGTGMPPMSSGLRKVGHFDVRYVEGMDMGPSVIMVESCYIGRIDGFPSRCLISQAYIHAGVNCLLASSRGSPGPGYLDERPRAVGFGLKEWIATKQDPDLQQLHFSGYLAKDFFSDLMENNRTTGMAFRNARNSFMEDADSTFFWTPPLALEIQTMADYEMFMNSIKPLSENEDNRCMEKKYTCQLEYNLLGDPAFNPYEPRNEGK